MSEEGGSIRLRLLYNSIWTPPPYVNLCPWYFHFFHVCSTNFVNKSYVTTKKHDSILLLPHSVHLEISAQLKNLSSLCLQDGPRSGIIIRRNQYSLRNIQYSLCNIQYSLCNIQYSLCNIQYSLCNIQYSLCNLVAQISIFEYLSKY